MVVGGGHGSPLGEGHSCTGAPGWRAASSNVAGSMELVVGGGQEIERAEHAQTALVPVGVHSSTSIAMNCAAGVGALPRRPWYGQLASVGDCTAPAAPVVGLLSPMPLVLVTKLVGLCSDGDGDQAKAGVVIDGAVCSGAAAAASSAGDAAAASLLYTSVLEWLRGDSAA